MISFIKTVLKCLALAVIAWLVYFLLVVTRHEQLQNPFIVQILKTFNQIFPQKENDSSPTPKSSRQEMAKLFNFYTAHIPVPDQIPQELKRPLEQLDGLAPYVRGELISRIAGMFLVEKNDYEQYKPALAPFFVDRLKVHTEGQGAKGVVSFTQSSFPSYKYYEHSQYTISEVYPNIDYFIIRVLGEYAVPELISALQDDDPFVRAYAALVLGKIRDNRAKNPLKTALNQEKEPGVSNNMSWALGEIPDEDLATIRRQESLDLVKELKTTTKKSRQWLDANQGRDLKRMLSDLFQELKRDRGKACPQECTDSIAELLKQTEDIEIFKGLIDVLIYADARDHVPEIASFLENRYWFRAVEDFSSLLLVGNLVLEDQNANENQSLEKPEGAYQWPDYKFFWRSRLFAVYQALQKYQSTDWEFKAKAIQGLAALHAEEYAPVIAQYLTYHHGNVVDIAMQALGKFKAVEYAPRIAQMIKKGTYMGTALTAITALNEMGVLDQYHDLITQMFHHDHPEVRCEIMVAIRKLDGRALRSEIEEFLLDLGSCLVDDKMIQNISGGYNQMAMSTVRLEAAKTLKIFMDPSFSWPDYAPRLSDFFSSESCDLILAAEKSAQMKNKEFTPQILPLLDHDQASERLAAVLALTQLGEIQATDSFIRMLKDLHPVIRESCAKGLGDFLSTKAVRFLVENLYDDQENVRHASAEALAKIDSEEPLEEMVQESLSEDDLVPVCNEKMVPQKCGYVNGKGETVIGFHFDGANHFHDGVAWVKKSEIEDNHYKIMYGLIDPSSQLLLPPEYEEVKDFVEGIALVKKDKQWMYINKEGAVIYVVDSQATDAGDFSRGYATINIAGEKRLLNHDGQLVSQDSTLPGTVMPFSEGLARYIVWFRAAGLDDNGNMIAGMEQQYADSLKSIIPGYPYGQWGYVNPQGEIVIPQKFADADDFHEGLAAVANFIKEEKFMKSKETDLAEHIRRYFDYTFGFPPGWMGRAVDFTFEDSESSSKLRFGYINPKGEIVIPQKFDWAFAFKDGLARVKFNNQWALIDSSGEIVANLYYVDDMLDFSEGLAVVKVGRFFGFINHRGKFVVAPRFKWAKSFSGGMAEVTPVGAHCIGTAVINRQGKYVWINRTE